MSMTVIGRDHYIRKRQSKQPNSPSRPRIDRIDFPVAIVGMDACFSHTSLKRTIGPTLRDILVNLLCLPDDKTQNRPCAKSANRPRKREILKVWIETQMIDVGAKSASATLSQSPYASKIRQLINDRGGLYFRDHELKSLDDAVAVRMDATATNSLADYQGLLTDS
ncbi:hypothetical protein ACFL6U_30425, partial [Planctomycetota bacterium]